MAKSGDKTGVKKVIACSTEAVVIVLAAVWFARSRSIESVITLIGSLSALAATLFVRTKPQTDERPDISLEKSRGNIVIGDVGAHANVDITALSADVISFDGCGCNESLPAFTETVETAVREIAGYHDDLTQVQGTIQKVEAGFLDLLRQFREKDISGLSEMYKEAFRSFMEGDYEQALRILNESKLEETEKDLAENRLLRGQILLSLDRLEEAEQNYLMAAAICPDAENYRAVGSFYLSISDYQEAVRYFGIALEKSGEGILSARILHSIGKVYHIAGNSAVAEEYYNRSDALFVEILTPGARIPFHYLIELCRDMGIMAFEKGRVEEGKHKFGNALDLLAAIEKTDPDQMPYALLADVCFEYAQGLAKGPEKDEAERLFIRATGTMEQHVCEEPDLCYPQLAWYYLYYANFLSGNSPQRAGEYYARALEVFENKVERYVRIFEPVLGQILINISRHYYLTDEEDATAGYLERCIPIFERLAPDRPDLYLPKLLFAYYQSARLAKEEREVAVHYYEKSIGVYSRMDEGQKERWKNFMVGSSYALGESYYYKSFDRALHCFESIVPLQESLVRENPGEEEVKQYVDVMRHVITLCYLTDRFPETVASLNRGIGFCLEQLGPEKEFLVPEIGRMFNTLLYLYCESELCCSGAGHYELPFLDMKGCPLDGEAENRLKAESFLLRLRFAEAAGERTGVREALLTRVRELVGSDGGWQDGERESLCSELHALSGDIPG